MHSVSIIFGPTGTNWRFLFNEAGKASIAAQAISSARDSARNGLMTDVEIVDDFGQLAHIDPREIHGLMLEDLAQTKLAYVELRIHSARCDAEVNKRARVDPVLGQMAAGPPIYSPMGNGPGGFRA